MDSETRTTASTADAPSAAARQVRAVLVEISPVFCFTVGYALTQRIWVAAPLALTVGVVVIVVRFARRRPMWRAAAALVVVALGAVLAARSGDAEDFFLPQLITSTSLVVSSAVLMLIGWPLAGIVTGLLTGAGTAWRRCRVRRRAFTVASAYLLISPLTMLAVQVPLYLAGNAVALGVAESLNPLVLLLATFLAWRGFARWLARHPCRDDTCPGHPADPARGDDTNR